MVFIKKFFEHQSVQKALTSAELIAFKRACTELEWTGYVTQAEAYCKANNIA